MTSDMKPLVLIWRGASLFGLALCGVVGLACFYYGNYMFCIVSLLSGFFFIYSYRYDIESDIASTEAKQ